MAYTIPLEKMSVEERLQAVELHWDGLCSKADGVSSPAWHADVLAERGAMQKSGDDEFADLDAAKRDIRNRIS